jgi:hypothetical protein
MHVRSEPWSPQPATRRKHAFGNSSSTTSDSIDVTTLAGLRDCALIGLMVFSFARVGAALVMREEDVHVQNVPPLGAIGDGKAHLFLTIGRGTGEIPRRA